MATGAQSWFNTDLWRNHYARSQRMGAQKNEVQPAAPTMGATAPGTLAAPKMSAASVSPAAATPQPAPPPAPTPAPLPAPGPLAAAPGAPAAAAAPTANPTSQDLQGDVLKQMAAGVNGQPLPGTEAALRQGRESLAQYARGLEAQAGARATKAGGVGQGTAASLGDEVKTNVLGAMSENARDSAQIVSTEKQALIDKATQAGQFQQTMDQRKAEFDKTFGSQESAKYLNQLERMAVDNPVLAEKLTNYLMGGKTGPVGEFTTEERAKLAEYVKKKGAQDDKLTEVMNKVLEGLPAQVAAGNKTATDATVLDAATKKLNAMKPGESLSDDEFKVLSESGGIRQASLATIPKGSNVNEWLTTNPSGIVNLDGKQYKVVRGGRSRTGAGTFSNQERHTDWVEVLDVKSGETKYVVNPYRNEGSSHGYSKDKAGIYDKPPGSVSNDISPFGF